MREQEGMRERGKGRVSEWSNERGRERVIEQVEQ